MIPDSANNFTYLYEVYLKAKSDFSGRITVPVLWDKATNTIVSNDSAEIMLMLNNGFDCDNGRDFYPEELKA